MGDLWYYASAERLALADLERLLDLESLEDYSASVTCFSAEVEVELAGLGELTPDFRSIEQFSFEGHLPPGEESASTLAMVLEEFGGELAEEQGCSAEILFEESESEQIENTAEVASVLVFPDRRLFSFSPGASRVVADREYGKRIMRELALEGGLPIVFEENGKGYSLRHVSESGEYHALRSRGDGLDPIGFQCSLDLASSTDEVRLLRDISERWGSGRVFSYRWTVFSEEIGDSDQASRLFNRVVAVEPRARLYSVGLSIRLGEIDEIERLRPLCGEEEVAWAFGSFLLPEDNYVNMEVRTNSEGHALQLECRYPVDVAQLSEALGVEIAEVGSRLSG